MLPGKGKNSGPGLGKSLVPGRGKSSVPGRGESSVPGRGKSLVPGGKFAARKLEKLLPDSEKRGKVYSHQGENICCQVGVKSAVM